MIGAKRSTLTKDDRLTWLKLLGDLREVPRLQRRGLARPLADYARAHNRNQKLVAAYRSGYYTMKQIGDHFGVHYATLSRAVWCSESEGRSRFAGHDPGPRPPGNDVLVTGADLRTALDALLVGGTIPEDDQLPSMGCNIKWAG